MTELQDKLLQLLTEIDEICKRESIRYYLCGETAHGALKRQAFYPQCCQANVAMTTLDARKFIAAVKKENRADRVVDSMLTNKTYPAFTVRYGDRSTTMINLPYRPTGPVPCIAVTIHIIRYKNNTAKAKLCGLARKFWECCMKTPAGRSFKQKVLIFGCHAVWYVLGRARVSRWLFEMWSKAFAPNKAKTFAIDQGKYAYDTAWLKQEETATLEGRQFPVFGNVAQFLNKFYNCPNFLEMIPNYEKESLDLLISAYVPYEKYLQQAQTMGVDFKAIYRNYKDYETLHQIVGDENKKISKYYAIVDRTQKRFEMYEKYMPIKKVLVQMYEQARYEELNTLLKPYRSALRACHKKGLGLCFDKEIFDMTMHLLRLEDRHAYAKKLQALVPKQHWAPMVVTDYKGQLVEITEFDQLPPEYLNVIEGLQDD